MRVRTNTRTLWDSKYQSPWYGPIPQQVQIVIEANGVYNIPDAWILRRPLDSWYMIRQVSEEEENENINDLRILDLVSEMSISALKTLQLPGFHLVKCLLYELR